MMNYLWGGLILVSMVFAVGGDLYDISQNTYENDREYVLGMDQDDEIVQQRSLDSLKEVLNVICGNLLTVIAGEEPIFNLSVPETDTIGPDEWQQLIDDPDSQGFLVDDNPVLLVFKT